MRIAFGDDFVSFENSYLLYLKLKKILEFIISFSGLIRNMAVFSSRFCKKSYFFIT